jgi:hypothetical protein
MLSIRRASVPIGSSERCVSVMSSTCAADGTADCIGRTAVPPSIRTSEISELHVDFVIWGSRRTSSPDASVNSRSALRQPQLMGAAGRASTLRLSDSTWVTRFWPLRNRPTTRPSTSIATTVPHELHRGGQWNRNIASSAIRHPTLRLRLASPNVASLLGSVSHTTEFGGSRRRCATAAQTVSRLPLQPQGSRDR